LEDISPFQYYSSPGLITDPEEYGYLLDGLETMSEFKFNNYGILTDGEIEVIITEKRPGVRWKPYTPAYYCDICLAGDTESIGSIDLRITNTTHIMMYGGHIGYDIDKKFRGNHYAAKACNIIKKVALDHGFKTLWITCNPDNYPSRRTCEILGCKMVEVVDVPVNTDMYRDGDKQKCRYRWDLANG